MDLYCQLCGEPWDFFFVIDEIDAEAEDGKRRFLDGAGCPACDWGTRAPEERPEMAVMMQMSRELLGDDIDGIAATLDDYTYGR